jgi:PKD repeat protein
MPLQPLFSGLFRIAGTFQKCAIALSLIYSTWLSIPAHAGQLTFAWDYTASGAAGLMLYCGTSTRNYTIKRDVGNQVSYTQTGLTDGARYYCAVTAYDPAKAESGFSNEVSAVVPTGAPVVNFTAAPMSGSPPLTVTFTNTTSGSVTSWSWNFGDGTTSTAQNPTKTYASSGSYVVSLTATGPGGTVTKNASTPITVVAGGTTPAGLVAAYGFNEGTGTTTKDSSGRGNIGTIASAVWASAGKFGKALSFNGTSSWITVADSASLDLTSGMTLEAWVYPTAAMSAWRMLIGKQQPGGLAYFLYANGEVNRPVSGIYTSAEYVVNGSSVLPINTWTHLAGTYDGAYQRLYVNGVLVSSRVQTGAIRTSNDVLRIGGNSIWNEYFKGLIDEVRIYNRALSATEIQSDLNRAIQ